MRQKLLKYLKDNKIDARQMVNPINDSIHIKKLIKKNFYHSNRISKSSIHLPSSLNLTIKEISYIVNKLNNFFKNER